MSRSPRILYLCLLFLGAALPLTGEVLPSTDPDEVGLSAERLARLDGALRKHIDQGELAGAVALIARRGKVAYFEALGRMSGDGDEAVPMRADALFGIASMTKPITSTAVMMLYEEDRFRLEDPISRFIPELKELSVAVVAEGHSGPDAPFTKVPAEREITIRDLLRHTSGFTYDFMDPGPVGKLYREEMQPQEGATLGDFLAKLGELPLVAHPGDRFVYGVSTDVLGHLVELISGKPLGRFFEERIFRPLGMNDTAFYLPEEKAGRMTTLYIAGEDGKVKPGVRPYFRGYREPPTAASGGGGLVSTAADYSRFLQMFLSGGKLDGVRLLSRKAVELMTTSHLDGRPFQAGYEFGLGFAVRVGLGSAAKLGSVGEYAWSGLFSTYFFVDPREEMFAILMTQTSPYDYLGFGERFKTLVYQAIDD